VELFGSFERFLLQALFKVRGGKDSNLTTALIESIDQFLNGIEENVEPMKQYDDRQYDYSWRILVALCHVDKLISSEIPTIFNLTETLLGRSLVVDKEQVIKRIRKLDLSLIQALVSEITSKFQLILSRSMFNPRDQALSAEPTGNQS
jgi:hypothetical protein